MNLIPFTIEEQVREIEREIKLRERVYPSWVYTGRLSQRGADRQLACMQAVLETLRGLLDGVHHEEKRKDG